MKVKDITGERYGNLVVLVNDAGRDKCGNRLVVCLCDCGNKSTKLYGNLTRGTAIHCGCVDNKTQHGECGTRLYHCWRAMIKRSESRKNCHIYEPWLQYNNYRDWSLQNGYTDDKVLCRNGDSGNYEPNNVRWDTALQNTIESNAKYWVLTDPNGNKYEIYDLNNFLREHIGDKVNAYAKGLARVANGSQPSYRGWLCERIGRWK